MDSKHRKNTQSGFSLVELLVALFIIVALIRVVAPNLTPNKDANEVKQTAKVLAHQLQLSIEEAKWLRLNHAVSVNDQELTISVQRDGKWQTAKTLSIDTKIQIKTDKRALSKAATAIQADQPFDLLIFSGGEYTPFELMLISGRNQRTLQGDGFNALQIQD